jgi:phosphoribosylformimino-5-aminoimidazole carboxamide ribotide isomerase
MTNFSVIPAIELRGGLALRYESVGVGTRAVRVDPVALAREYVAAGAPMLHVYNLDGPFIVSAVEHSGSVLAGAERNMTVVGEIAQTVNVPVQLSGGVRDVESFKLVTQLGVQRAAFGSAAMRDPAVVKQAIAVNPGAVLVFLDIKDGRPVGQDWVANPKASVADVAAAMFEAGVRRFIYQDIDAEAAGAGPHAPEAAAVEALGAEVIVSGGIGTLDHVRAAAAIKGAAGVIVGKPLALRTFSYKQALEAARAGLAARN